MNYVIRIWGKGTHVRSNHDSCHMYKEKVHYKIEGLVHIGQNNLHVQITYCMNDP